MAEWGLTFSTVNKTLSWDTLFISREEGEERICKCCLEQDIKRRLKMSYTVFLLLRVCVCVYMCRPTCIHLHCRSHLSVFFSTAGVGSAGKQTRFISQQVEVERMVRCRGYCSRRCSVKHGNIYTWRSMSHILPHMQPIDSPR